MVGGSMKSNKRMRTTNRVCYHSFILQIHTKYLSERTNIHTAESVGRFIDLVFFYSVIYTKPSMTEYMSPTKS